MSSRFKTPPFPPPEAFPAEHNLGDLNQNLLTSLNKSLFAPEYGIWLWEPPTGKLYYNTAYMQMLGYGPRAFAYDIDSWKSLIHPDDSDATLAQQLSYLGSDKRGNSFESRYRLRKISGDYLWVLGKGFVLCRDDAGKALKVVGVHIDLFKLDQSLKQMLIEHDRMTFALEAAKDGIWDWDPLSGEVYYSPRYLSMLGFTPEDFPPSFESWAKRVHPDDLAATVETQLRFAANGESGDCFECVYRFKVADGSYKWILGRGKAIRRTADGRATRIVGLHTDITELRNTQEALAKLINHDPLTDLHSRFYFEAELQKLKPEEHPVSIIYCDIDCLKLVNDNLGHATGDMLLATAATMIRQSIRVSDIAARIGGDEFIVLLLRCPEAAALRVLEQLRDNLNLHNTHDENIPVYMSLGMVSTEKETAVHKLVAKADRAMLRHKHKNRQEHLAAVRQWIEQQLHTAIDPCDNRL